MAEVPGRMDFEAEFAKELAKLMQVSLGKLMELLGDPPNINNVPPSFWQEAGEELRIAAQRNFQDIYLASAQQILDAQPIGVEWDLINQQAIDYASNASFDLISGITQNSRQQVQQAISSFFSEQQTIGDLQAALQPAFGPVRAELIASTETTRASVQGERALVEQLETEGAEMIKRWLTSRDEKVCPICQPLDGKPFSEWRDRFPDGPPAHPRCRCDEAHSFAGRREVLGG